MIDIQKIVRTNIQKLKPYTSARDSYQSGILLDANENSFGSVSSSDLGLNRYPDPSQKELRNKLGNLIGVNPDKLFFGVGSDEVIDLLIRIFCEPRIDNVVIPQPTYGMYEVACDINNVTVRNVELNDQFQIDVDSTIQACDANTKIIFLCSPNNPTGNALNKDIVLEVCKSFNGIVVVDEAYIDFDEGNSLVGSIEQYNNLVITRTFSKAWGLAGARCGYCVADKSVVDYLFKIKAPYNLNKLTVNEIISALDKKSVRDNFIEKLNSEKNRVINQLESFDKVQKVFPSDANFVLFKCDNARNVYNLLAQKGVIIRDRSNQIKLENCLRVSIGTEEENDMFINTLREVL